MTVLVLISSSRIPHNLSHKTYCSLLQGTKISPRVQYSGGSGSPIRGEKIFCVSKNNWCLLLFKFKFFFNFIIYERNAYI